MTIRLTKKIAAFIAILATSAACSGGDQAAEPEAKSASIAQASADGFQECTSADQCRPGFYCSKDGARCGEQTCVGVCLPDRPAACGDALCDAGLVCCNPSCGVCALPGDACTEKFCRPRPTGPASELTLDLPTP